MIENAAMIERLTSAAEEIYKHADKSKGFYAGKTRLPSGVITTSYNCFEGAKLHLEQEMRRRLNKYEVAVLTLAIGHTQCPPALQEKDYKYSMEILWPQGNPDNRHRDLMRVLCAL